MPLGIFLRIYSSIFGTNPNYQPIPIHDFGDEGCLSTQIKGCYHVEHIPLQHAESKQIFASAINCILN